MPNKSPIKRRATGYKSEVVAFLTGNAIEPNDPSGQFIVVPFGYIDRNALIELEAVGELFQNTGFSRILQYNIGIIDGDTYQTVISCPEQSAIASSVSNFFQFRFRYMGGVDTNGIFEVQRTFGAISGNNQVTMSTLKNVTNQNINSFTEGDIAATKLNLIPHIDTTLGDSLNPGYFMIKATLHTPYK